MGLLWTISASAVTEAQEYIREGEAYIQTSKMQLEIPEIEKKTRTLTDDH